MSNTKHYPTHPGAEHPPIMTCEIPLEEYESIKRENAELKDEIKRLENVRKVHIESIESMCEWLKLDAKQICKTQRALWLARAMRAQESQYWGAYVRYVHLHENSFYEFINDDIFRRDNPNNDSFRIWSHRWQSVERKCRAKAEEYK